MTRDEIRSYLNGIDWKEFRSTVADVMSSDPNSTPVMAGLYEQVRLGKIFPSRTQRFFYGLIWLLLPVWLLVRKLVFLPWTYPRRIRQLGLCRPEDFDGDAKRADVLVMLGATFPSLYDSLHRILVRLDEDGTRVTALAFGPVVKWKGDDIRSFKQVRVVSMDDEVARLSPREMFRASWTARGKYRRALGNVREEAVRALFQHNQQLITMLLMFDNLFEAAYRRMFAQIRPRVIVDNWFNGALLKVARDLKIYTVMIQHGTQWGDDKPGITPDEDELLIWGEFWRENFRRHVLPSTKLISMGCPRFDPLAEHREKGRDRNFYERLNLNPERLTFTFLSQSHGFVFPEETRLLYRRAVAALVEFIAARGDQINFVLKLHPHDDLAYYRELMDPALLSRICVIKYEAPLYDLFRHTDMAMTVTSTSILEAIAIGVTAIQFDSPSLTDWIDFCTPGGGFLVRSGEDLIRTFDRLTDSDERQKADQKREAFLELTLTNLGTATDKVAAHLLALADKVRTKA